ncbi:aromatic-ring-hydroxylating dioxygenase subunit beta [Conexibacter arvalis]|uniref:3-phenylpropionate/cinnamic acid dioxygenase small subunit n=1 Tax=Conexibacter arvalis TaxID=912552 RepID=A0A840IA70_9ACTN|nr:aromatic-ring-hydroxylating dioxygenase subunit beta [Conexibacter arvalis]MBB4661817.1 3-phenylpropionate/cinnamic acid dioxygenase small subunit [Conexibacter arvalis]
MSASETVRPVAGSQDPALLADVAAFLYHEAELLDALRLEEWLELYAEDAVYWIPQGPDADPRVDVQLLLDDRTRLRERVLRLSSGFAYSQDPASRTIHLIGNVRIAGDGEVEPPALDVRSVQQVTEVRRGRQLQYVGHFRHVLSPSGDGGWTIRRKEVRLANSDLPLGNVTFLI